MAKPLKVLIVEDHPLDAELMVRELGRAGFVPEWERVETAAAFVSGLSREPDLILSDFEVPGFGALEALKLWRQEERYLPFIVVSGNIGEETAVETMKQGASDYVLKHRMGRLGPVVAHALEQAEVRRAHAQAVTEIARLSRFNEGILDSLSSHLCVLDERGEILAVNQAWVDAALVNPPLNGNVSVGVNYLSVCESAAQAGNASARSMMEGIRAVLHGELPEYSCEYESHLPEVRRWFLARVTRFREAAPPRIVVAHTNITERKLAEEALREQHLALANAMPGISRLDAAGCYLAVNSHYAQMLGYAPEEMVGLDSRQTVIPEDQRLARAAFETMQRVGRAEFEARSQRKDGSVFHKHVLMVKILSPGGESAGHHCFMRDISERKRSEETLRESELRFRHLIEHGSDIITVIDHQGTIRFQSPSSERILGYPAQELTGRRVFDFVHADDQVKVAAAIKGVKAHSDVPELVELRFRDAAGRWRILESIGRHFPGELPESQIIVNSRDVTESRGLAEQYRQAQKMEAIGRLAGGVAHDFNNMLGVIEMNADMVKLGELSPEQSESVDEISKAAQRAASLTRQLLLYSRRQVLQPRDLELNETISQMGRMLRRIVGEDVQIQMSCSPHPLWLHADPGMIDQVLLNLAVNSRDAMPQGGRLIIETSAVIFDDSTAPQHPGARPGEFVCLSVTDTGSGIAAEVLPKIFDPFFTTKDVGKGTGLGLATVFSVAQQHQGWVQVYSEAGHGATFRVYLPRLEPVAAATDAPAGAPVLAGGTETILLVEDEPAFRTLVRSLLTRLGYRVLEAPTGVLALKIWREHRHEIRLLFTDLIMPDGMNGRELAARLLQEAPQLKVIYTSGYSAEVAGPDFPLHEGGNYLAKPFQAAALAHTVRRRLDSPT